MAPATVINISFGDVEGQHLAFVIDNQVQFKAKRITDRTLPTFGVAIEDPVAVYPAIVTNLHVCKIDEVYAPALPQAAHLHQEHENHREAWL